MTKLLISILALIVASAASAHAAGDHAGKYGGKVVESGHHHLEVVAKDGGLEIYVEGEDGKPEDVSKAKATAVVLAEGKKHDVELTPAAGNLLKGSGSFKAAKGTTIVITLTMPDHKPEQARITLD
jgi:hypothetical protein